MSDTEHEESHSKGGHGGGGHAMEEEHEEGVAEWVISFADNALLQMGFFVLLLALNMKEGQDGHGGRPSEDEYLADTSVAMLDGAIAIRQAFNNPVNLASTSEADMPLVRRIIQRREGTAIEDGPPGDKQNVQTVRPTDYKRPGGVVFFEDESRGIEREGQETIEALATQYMGRKTIIEVRGHTSLAESRRSKDRGMRLSFDRAMAVVDRLIEEGLASEQLRVVSIGAADRASPLARSRNQRTNNQRVEIIITNENMPDDPYSVDPSGQ